MLAPRIRQDKGEGRHLPPIAWIACVPPSGPIPRAGRRSWAAISMSCQVGTNRSPFPQGEPDPQTLGSQGIDPSRRQTGEKVGLVERAARRLLLLEAVAIR